MTIRKLLIANRGEIARRIMRTARALGIRSVAVYSDADAGAPFVREADEAVCIGAPPANESYLVVEGLLEACRRSGADAVHPGYGFLSENAGFARAVIDAGLTWVGPSPEAIDAMGSKAEAKALMESHGVPTVPGYSGEEQSTAHLRAESSKIAFPLLLKASAGGGGKGMRIVREEAELTEAIEAAKREASSAFGDSRLILERYVEQPRHIEFQILGDRHGNLVHLFDRECSVQRRHQKVLEEAPSPGLDPALRDRMAQAAVAAGHALSYASAGTVEFILAPDGEFYFLEVNTRLQVEHPVTEMVTGLDLVALQLAVAEGTPLPFTQDEVTLSGHAIEARLYAEDPDNSFLPCTGPVLDWNVPAEEGVRVDSGVERGSEVGVHYDPMLAKVIAYAQNRTEATRRLHACLESASVLGLTTNRRFLCRVLDSAPWREAALHTHFIEEHADALRDPLPGQRLVDAAAVATFQHVSAIDEAREILPALSYGWRNNPLADERYAWTAEGVESAIAVSIGQITGSSWRVEVNNEAFKLEVLERCEGSVLVALNGLARRYRVRTLGERVWVHDGVYTITLAAQPAFPDKDDEASEGGCQAPMPGKVLSVKVKAGDAVDEGDALVILEAMKMEHTLSAAKAGTVKEVLVSEGEQVDGGDALVLMADTDDEA